MTEEPIKECPKCKGLVKRLIGAGAGLIFNGSGFYETDYKSHGNNGAKKSSVSTSPSNSTKIEPTGTGGTDKK
jgi:predicted nucleic acid-binding Zn ribbon protein